MATFATIAMKLRYVAKNLDSFFQEIFTDEKISNVIIRTVQQRLYKDGETGTGKKLETDKAIEEGAGYLYAKSTIFSEKPPNQFDGKKARNQPYDRVTLFSDGIFSNSFDVLATKLYFEINADFETGKESHIYANFQKSFSSESNFENEVTSLTKNELVKILKDYAEIELEKKISQQLKAA